MTNISEKLCFERDAWDYRAALRDSVGGTARHRIYADVELPLEFAIGEDVCDPIASVLLLWGSV